MGFEGTLGVIEETESREPAEIEGTGGRIEGTGGGLVALNYIWVWKT